MRTVPWIFALLACLGTAARGEEKAMNAATDPTNPATGQSVEIVTLGGGCFWCLEAVFLQVKGVRSVESGYSGGNDIDPSYEEVCSGTTGHAEVVQVTFDPKIITLHDLLSIFFTIHDPTTPNRQGADVGSQYRSVIFYRNAEQKAVADSVMKEIHAAKIWGNELVTQLVPFAAFYKAEGYHQRYYERNPEQGYCRVVIEPKVRKFREKFKDMLVGP
jgi:peptide-methionine (S)-S-oxide reductase